MFANKSLISKILLSAACCIFFTACDAQNRHLDSANAKSFEIESYYSVNKGNGLPSYSKGTTGNGSLENGKLVPFEGKNFKYFDTTSYLSGRAYLHEQVLNAILEAYTELSRHCASRTFYIMECSNKTGGEMFPHRTHQNGLSVDFMVPKIKNGETWSGLDTIGKDHYWLQFNNEGRYTEDSEVTIDFDMMALHILELNKTAQNNGLKISKVIFKIELKDLLFSTENGKILEKSGIYFAQSLSPLINELHDEHYHVDFEILQ